MDFKNVIFDFGGVLLDLDPEKSFEALADLLSVERELLSTQKYQEYFDKFEMGKIKVETFLWNLQRAAEKTPQPLEVVRAWNAMLLGLPEVKLSALKDISSRYPTYLLSNTNEVHLTHVKNEINQVHGPTDFDGHFIKAYYSHEIGMRKPNRDIFDFVAEDAGIEPSESLFIDDNADNISMAQKVGYQTILHPRNAPLPQVLFD